MRLLVSPAAKILQDLSLVFVYGTLKRGFFNSKVKSSRQGPSCSFFWCHLLRGLSAFARGAGMAPFCIPAYTPLLPHLIICLVIPYTLPAFLAPQPHPSTGTNVAVMHGPHGRSSFTGI